MVNQDDPIARFEDAFRRAAPLAVGEPAAVTLATADAAGRPSARVVLLKGVDARGFVFYTNYESRKARELAQNPFAALCFHWPALGEQVRVEGRVGLASAEESDAYSATRPRPSQIGAWASRQSETLPSREDLMARVQEIEARFAGREVPRPPNWGGFRLAPSRVEFWKHAESRLHER